MSEKMFMKLNQEETGYRTVSGTLGTACASCRWFMGDCCAIVDGWPEAIMPTGICNRHETGVMPEPEPMEVSIVNINEISERAASDSILANAIKTVAGWFNGLLPDGKPETGESVFKALGNGVWFAAYTNNFEDREGEIISEKAHDRYVARVNAGLVPMPELWHYHVPGTRHGVAKAIWRDGHVVCAAGTFDDTPAGRAAEKAYRRQRNIELSHGFRYPSWALKAGVYEDINTFEISTLPPGRAANPYTTFEEVEAMALSDEQKKSILATFGAEQGQAIIDLNNKQAERAKTLAESGAKFKDYADLKPEETAKSVDSEGLKAFASGMIDGQEELLAQVEAMSKAFASGMKRIDEAVARAEAAASASSEARKAFEAKTADLQKQLDAAPRRVTDSRPVQDDGAKKALDDMKNTEEELQEELGIFYTPTNN